MNVKRSLLLFVLVTSCASAPRSAPPHTATPLPNVELATLAATPTTLAVELAMRPALVSLWATWCDTCVAELGALDRLSTKVAPRGGYVVAVAEGESSATVAAFVKAKALGYPQLIDEKYLLGDAIGARQVPTTLVIDRKGAIIFRGASLDEAALRAFDAALKP